MFERFVETQDFLHVPISGKLYRINNKGIILDLYGNVIPTFLNEEKDLVVNLFWIEGYKSYKVSYLLATVFKPINIPIKLWKFLTVKFKDNNNQNLSLDNLIWKFPKEGLECEKNNGYYYIPCFTKYVINKEGSVIQHFTQNKLKGSHNRKDNYVYFNLMFDVAPNKIKVGTSIGRHRLLAITFLDYPINADNLDINHINGKPGDDWIENLEWVTRSQNISHAFKNGFRTDNKEVIVTNHITGEISQYYSAYECERQLGLNRSSVYYRIKSGSVFPPGLSFKYKNGHITKCNKDKYGIEIIMLNTKTNEVKEFKSIIECSKFLNVHKKVIQRRLKNKIVVPFRDYVFERKNVVKECTTHSKSLVIN